MGPIPNGVFLTKGFGVHREKLNAFELALRSAQIAEFNLVRVNSIFPPQCKLITPQEGLRYLKPGQIVFAVVCDNATDEPHRLMASSVGVATPTDPAQLRLSLGASQFRRDRAKGRRLCRGSCGDDAGDDSRRRVRSEFELRRAQGYLAGLRQAVPHA